MTRFGHYVVICAIGLAIGFGVGCAGKKRASKNPADCMRQCDQENCSFVADGVGDNAAYLDCLEACEDDCNPG